MGSHSNAEKDESATETETTTTRRGSLSVTESNTDCDGDALPPPPLANVSQFEEGEKVLANHKGRFYEAKVMSFVLIIGVVVLCFDLCLYFQVLEVAFKDNEWNYYVHYIVSKIFYLFAY